VDGLISLKIRMFANPTMDFKVSVLAQISQTYNATAYKISAKSSNLELSFSNLKI